MRSLSEFKEFYLFTDFMDMRKDINALSFLAESEFSADWSKPQLFVFIGRTKKLVKILYYDQTGFALWKKRLEKDSFPFLKTKDLSDGVLTLDLEDLRLMLSGVNIFSKHEAKFYSLTG